MLVKVLRTADDMVQPSHKYAFDLPAIGRDSPDLIVCALAASEETRGRQRVQMLRLHPTTVAIPALVGTMQRTLVAEMEGHLLALSIDRSIKPLTVEQVLTALQRILTAQPHTALRSDVAV